MWLKACRYEAGVGGAVVYCFAGACHAGCGKSKSQCEADWKAFDGSIVVKHTALPLPIAKVIKMSPDPEFTLVRAALARGGGLKEHDKCIAPKAVAASVGKLLADYVMQKTAKSATDAADGGSGGSVMPAARAPRTTGVSGGDVCEDLESLPLGGGSAALFCKGRGGRACPKSLAELKFADHEQDLDSVVNDRDERPPTPLSSSARVPARGLGDFFKFIFPSEDDLWREATADWLLESASLASALAGQGAGVQSYVRSLGVTLLLNEVADPRASDLDSEAAWLLVRSRALAVAATATDAAIQDWALSFCEPVVACGLDVSSAAVGKSGRCALITAKTLAPGGESFSEVLGDRWPVKDLSLIHI